MYDFRDQGGAQWVSVTDQGVAIVARNKAKEELSCVIRNAKVATELLQMSQPN